MYMRVRVVGVILLFKVFAMMQFRLCFFYQRESGGGELAVLRCCHCFRIM